MNRALARALQAGEAWLWVGAAVFAWAARGCEPGSALRWAWAWVRCSRAAARGALLPRSPLARRNPLNHAPRGRRRAPEPARTALPPRTIPLHPQAARRSQSGPG